MRKNRPDWRASVNYRAFSAHGGRSSGGRMIAPSARRAAFHGETFMSTTESAAPAPAAPADAGKECCRKSCCSKKGCGTNGKCCVCCGTCLSYTGASLLTVTGLAALYLWLTKLVPAYSHFLAGAGKAFCGCTLFCMSAAPWLGYALPLVAIGVIAIHMKCCARCAPRLLFTYGLIVTIAAFCGLICSGIDIVLALPAH